MNGLLQPKYVGTFRKVDVGMVNAAGTTPPTTCCCMEDCVHACIFHWLTHHFPPLGIYILRMMQLFQIEDLQYPPSTQVLFALLLTKEGQSLLLCRLSPARNAADQSLWVMLQILQTTLSIWQQIMVRNSHKILVVLIVETGFG